MKAPIISMVKQALQESKDSEKLAKENALMNLAELENFKKRNKYCSSDVVIRNKRKINTANSRRASYA